VRRLFVSMLLGALVATVAVIGVLPTTATATRTYWTNFPATENPISESANWINGGSTGLDWSNMRSTPGRAFGTQVGNGTGPAQFSDSAAILTGVWGNNQGAQATVYVTTTLGSWTEVELHLRFSVAAHNLAGYEFECSVAPGDPYMDIVRWNGPLGNYTPLVHGLNGCANGDVLGATAVGSTLTLYKNGVVQLTATDTVFPSGAPGIGAYLQNQPGTNANYGLSNFAANDSGTLPGLGTPTSTPIPPTKTATVVPPTSTPTRTATPTPTPVPTSTPTSTTVPTSTPTSTPTLVPTSTPTSTPTLVPTSTPTTIPTSVPTSTPTSTATPAPTSTATPTSTPTIQPTDTPTPVPCAVVVMLNGVLTTVTRPVDFCTDQ
jgi:hypothetical protein